MMEAPSEQWLDTLSEDWNSSPRSLPSSLPRHDAPAGSGRNPVKDLHRRSRIPRSTVSGHTSIHSGSGSKSATRSPSRQALSERSASVINSRPRSSPSAHPSHGTQAKMASRPSTIASANSIIKHGDGSVVRDSAVEQKTPANELPEWKQLAMRKQDLFSPIELEGMFQKPPSPTKQSPLKSSFSFLHDLESMPSSPPARPRPHRDASPTTQHAQAQSARMLHEIEEEPHSEGTGTEQDTHARDLHMNRDVESREDESTHACDSGNKSGKASDHNHEEEPVFEEDGGSTRHTANKNLPFSMACEGGIGSSSSISQRPSEPLPSRPDPSHGFYSPASPHESHQSDIRGGSSSVSGGFSPVFISKHNTVDGRVDYAAFDPSELPSIGEHVSCDRGGHSDDGSFRRKPLSPSLSSAALLSDSVAPSDSISQVHRHSTNAANKSDGIGNTIAQYSEDKRHPKGLQKGVIREPGSSDISENRAAGAAGTSSASLKSLSTATGDDTVQDLNRFPTPRKGVTQASLGNYVGHFSEPHRTLSNEQTVSDLQSVETVLKCGQTPDAEGLPEQAMNDDSEGARRGAIEGREPSGIELQPGSAQLSAAPAEEPSQPLEYFTDTIQSQHQRLQAMAGRKRKDARYDDGYPLGNASTIAKRDTLRPRNPTPGQGHRTLMRSTSVAGIPASNFVQHSQAVCEPSASVLIPARSREAATIRALASEVATFRMHSRVAQLTGIRKQSVSTQDYIDEAMKIMDLIRARKNVNSDAPSSELSGGEDEPEPELEADMTAQTISRPPSRDGPISGWRSNAFEQVDSRVLNHLRKYEETGDDSFLVSSIVRTAKIAEEPLLQHGDEGIRITDDPNRSMTRRHSDPTLPRPQDVTQESAIKTQSSDRSTDSSGRTVQTTSTQRTRNMARIAPEHVSHLIQDEEAGMRFDTQRQTWVRTKKSRLVLRTSGQLSSSTGTDDDVFQQIPDLSVNEQEEQAHSRTPSKSEPTRTQRQLQQSPQPLLHPDTALYAQQGKQSVVFSRELKDQTMPSAEGDEEHFELGEDSESLEVSEVTGNIEIGNAGHERLAKKPEHVRSSKREQSVFFSSPPVSRAWEAKHWTDSTNGYHEDAGDAHETDIESSQVVPWRANSQNHTLRSPVAHQQIARNTSLSCIDERHEISLIEKRPDGRTMSLSLSISTPLPRSRVTTAPMHVGSALRHQNFLRSLSPLSSFSVNQDDRHHPYANATVKPLLELERYGGHAKTRSSLVVRNLVEKLTSAEPDEPYWDFMAALDLSKKGIDALYALDEFCPRLEELDASSNQIKHLDGAPSSIRHLRLCNNMISSLTGWAHLSNLQYLNVSGNALNSLDGFSSLVHLRKLTADDNQITSIDGILDLDGLLTLSLRGNKLQEVDFSTAELQRLEHLDMSNNEITQVEGLCALSRLQSLNLENNSLATFVPEAVVNGPHHCVRSLRSLNVSNNKLASLSISTLPRLSSLSADNNSLDHIVGIESHRRLRTLHLGNQSFNDTKGISSLDVLTNLTHLHLSGTPLSPLLPMTVPFPRLQTLDISFTGIQALPAEFGLLVPSLQTLNLNSNNLKDLRPLDGIAALRTLLVAENRLGRLRMLMRVLKGLGSLRGGALAELDFRGNPLCVGFYPTSSHKAEGPATIIRTSGENDMSHVDGRPLDDLDDEDDASDVPRDLGHLLPLTDIEEDKRHWARLDEDMKMKRRVYEMLLAAKCPKLERADGMKFQRARLECKDEVWDALVRANVVERASGVGGMDGTR